MKFTAELIKEPLAAAIITVTLTNTKILINDFHHVTMSTVSTLTTVEGEGMFDRELQGLHEFSHRIISLYSKVEEFT